MNLRDELEPAKANGGVCSVKAFVINQPNVEEWLELLDDKSIQHSRIHRLMKKYDYELTANPIVRHRGGQCSCGRS